MFTSELSDLLGQSASSSSKKITQGAEFLALWNTCLTARSLSPTYWDITQKKISSIAGRCVLKKNSISSCSEPLFQSESKCESIDMKIIFYSRANKTHFHKRSFALSLVLKARVFGTRKRPIMVMLEGKRVIHVNFEFLNSIGPRAHIGRAKILAYPPWKNLYHSRMT